MPDRNKIDQPLPTVNDLNNLNNNHPTSTIDDNGQRVPIVTTMGGIQRRISDGERIIPVEVIRTFTNDLRIEVDDDLRDTRNNHNGQDGGRSPGILMLQETDTIDTNRTGTIDTTRTGTIDTTRTGARTGVSNRSDDEISCDGTMTPSDGTTSELATPEEGPTGRDGDGLTGRDESTIVSKSSSDETNSSFSANGLMEASRGDIYELDKDGRLTAYVDFTDWYRALDRAGKEGMILSFD